MKQKRIEKVFVSVFSVIMILLCTVPFAAIIAQSFQIDGQFSTLSYYKVFVSTPTYLYRFWRSLGMSLCVCLGQLLVSVFAAFAFAKIPFRGREPLFFLLMIFMVIPVQVTIVPNYMVLADLDLLDTYAGLILPAIVAPLGTFILRQCFAAIPDAIIDAAQIDGCGPVGILFRVAIPMNISGLICVTFLTFLDTWNMVEQPISYLRSFEKYPLAVALSYAPPENAGIHLVCCILVLLPPLLLFLFFGEDLTDGITLGEVK